MYYLIGDIHGHLEQLQKLAHKVAYDFKPDEDKFIFLGDYIDRGPSSFETIEFLISLSKKADAVFLKGNHEDMLFKFLKGQDVDLYLYNGGRATVASYEKALGSMIIPDNQKDFFSGLKMYYEGDDFIAVHAGLNPEWAELSEQKPIDLMWIRDKFYTDARRWQKTIIFGHTPVQLIKKAPGIHFDENRNIIGIDNGVFLGYPMFCLRWPDKKVYSSL